MTNLCSVFTFSLQKRELDRLRREEDAQRRAEEDEERRLAQVGSFIFFFGKFWIPPAHDDTQAGAQPLDQHL